MNLGANVLSFPNISGNIPYPMFLLSPARWNLLLQLSHSFFTAAEIGLPVLLLAVEDSYFEGLPRTERPPIQ